MSRRMIDPQVIIKSQIADDKFQVDLNEIVEKYGTVMSYGDKTITLQIYNKVADDDQQNYLYDDNVTVGSVVVNGTITITKQTNNALYIQGLVLDNNNDFITYLQISSGSYENGFFIGGSYEFDVYVIKV